MTTEMTGGRRPVTEQEHAERVARLVRILGEARSRRMRKIAAGEHVCPPFPEPCGRPECQDRP